MADFYGINISNEDAKSIIQKLQKGMIIVSDQIEVAEVKTQLATERTQERLFEAEEILRMEFDEFKRLNDVLKKAIENEKKETKNPDRHKGRYRVGGQ